MTKRASSGEGWTFRIFSVSSFLTTIPDKPNSTFGCSSLTRFDLRSPLSKRTVDDTTPSGLGEELKFFKSSSLRPGVISLGHDDSCRGDLRLGAIFEFGSRPPNKLRFRLRSDRR